jgi:signal transduction histidine kinase
LARAIRGEVVNGAEQFVCHSKIPEGRWLSVTARPLNEEESVRGGGVVVFQDVTERKRAQDAIRQLNEQLEQRVVERTAELMEANHQLAQKNQENEMFVYSVSHDLRSPLVNLEGFSRELSMVSDDLRSLLGDGSLPLSERNRALALLDGDMAESIRFIQTGVRRLSTIIDALLRLSRAGRVEYRRLTVEVADVVGLVVESLGATIAERGAAVRVKNLRSAWGDPTAIEQIFANLIGNALNYLDQERPGIIEVGSEGGAWGDETDDQPALLTYYVKDNGLGIPNAYRSKVFQAFQRLHPDKAKGEGVGLAMVRRIVERHGGEIWLESSEGVGSTFFVTLPAPPPNRTSIDLKPAEASTPEMELEVCQTNNSLSF